MIKQGKRFHVFTILQATFLFSRPLLRKLQAGSFCIKMVLTDPFIGQIKDILMTGAMTPTKSRKRRTPGSKVIEEVTLSPTPTKKERTKKTPTKKERTKKGTVAVHRKDDDVVFEGEVSQLSTHQIVDDDTRNRNETEDVVRESETPSKRKKSRKGLQEGQVYREFRSGHLGLVSPMKGDGDQESGHRQRVKNSNLVSVFVSNDTTKNPNVLAFWDSCSSQDPRSVTFTWSEDRKRLVGVHKTNKRVTYSGIEFKDPDFEYLMTVRDPTEPSSGQDAHGISGQDADGLTLVKMKIYRIRPIVNLVPIKGLEETIKQEDTRTRGEKMIEAMSKFGSKKANRNLVSRTKSLSMKVDAEDVQALQDAGNKVTVSSQSSTSKVIDNGTSSQVGTSDLLPPRNAAASSVTQVYNISDLMSEELITILTGYIEGDDKLAIGIELVNNFIPEEFTKVGKTETKNTRSKTLAKDGQEGQSSAPIKTILPSDPDVRENVLIAFYIDLLMRVYHLKQHELRRLEPLKEIENSSVRTFLMEMFIESRKEIHKGNPHTKHFLTDKKKDQILITVFILLIKLTNYTSIKVDEVTTGFKLPAVKVRSIGQLVGCHHHKKRAIDQLVFKIPIYEMQMNKIKRKR